MNKYIVLLAVIFTISIEGYTATINSVGGEKIVVNGPYVDEAGSRSRQCLSILNSSIPHGIELDFVTIRPGSFMMGDKIDEKSLVSITKSYQIGATQISQDNWLKVVTILHKVFPDEYNKYNMLARPSHFNGRNKPVDSVSWNNVNRWINGLNKISSMPSKEIQTMLKKIMPSHNLNDIYRLPTSAEWEFVARERGNSNTTFHFGNSEAQLLKYANVNSSGTTDVASLQPMLIDCAAIYDIHGNVMEWVSDKAKSDNLSQKNEAVDPIGPKVGRFHILRGGSWLLVEYVSRSGNAHRSELPSFFNSQTGFRLVRVGN